MVASTSSSLAQGRDREYVDKLRAHYHHGGPGEAEKDEKDFEVVISHSAAVSLLEDAKMLEDQELGGDEQHGTRRCRRSAAPLTLQRRKYVA